MTRDKQGTDVPAEPDSMDLTAAVNGETPPDGETEVHRTGKRQAERNRENEPPV